MERPAMQRLVRDSRRHAPLLVVGVVAIVVLVSTAVVIGASRQAPDRDAGLIALASPSPRPSATPSMTPAPTPSITPVAGHADADRDHAGTAPNAATPTPEPSPDTDPCRIRHGSDRHRGPGLLRGRDSRRVEPEVALLIGGIEDEAPLYIRTGDTVARVLELQTYDLDPSDCSLTQSYEPDDPAGTPWTVALEPLAEQSISMKDGRHTFVATCGSEGDLTATVVAMVRDGKPEACRDFEFVRGEISVNSYEELTAGIVGTWKGCVTTPWTPMYEVTVTLREDGTYSAASDGGPRRQPT